MRYLLAIFSLFVLSFSSLAQTEVQWMTIEEAIEAQQVEKRKIFIDMYTDWCGWCKRMDATTFQDSEVVKKLNNDFYPVKFNAEKNEVISFKGEKYKLVRRGKSKYHELAVEFMKNSSRPGLSFPTFIFLDENLNTIQPIKGYKKVSQLLPILDYFSHDYHKNQSWNEFLANYKEK